MRIERRPSAAVEDEDDGVEAMQSFLRGLAWWGGRGGRGGALGDGRGARGVPGIEATPRRRREASWWPGDAGRQPGGVAPARAPCVVPPLPTDRGWG